MLGTKNTSPLQKKSRYCKHCKDTYWNETDTKSIADFGQCATCKKNEDLKGK